MKLIVEMEMPKGCYFCPMSATYPTDWYCMAYDNTKSIEGCAPMNKRPDWCPIKGVLPDEHGDLIDRDALMKAFCNHCDGDEPCIEPCIDIGLIETAPTVIAAERKDNEQID